MPTYRDLTVHVTNAADEPLQEHGVHKRDRSKLSTCYIQSETDMAFRILIKPEENLFTRELKDAQHHLLATLRLDGRETAEKRVIVYLDPEHPRFLLQSEDGAVMMKTRTYVGPDGVFCEAGWLFKEVGIDTLIDNLDLTCTEPEAVPCSSNDDDELASAFDALGANSMEDAEEKSTVGQIEITLERVFVDQTSKPWTPPNEYDTRLPSSELSKVSHTAARGQGSAKVQPMSVIYYAWDDELDGERHFATFKFYYRGGEVLRKLFGGAEARESTRKSKILSSLPPPLLPLASKACELPHVGTSEDETSRALGDAPAENSLEETSHVKSATMPSPAGTSPHHHRFPETGEEEADDEASDPSSPADEGSDGEDDGGVSKDQSDEGLGETLGGLDIRKRTGGDEEEEGESAKRVRQSGGEALDVPESIVESEAEGEMDEGREVEFAQEEQAQEELVFEEESAGEAGALLGEE